MKEVEETRSQALSELDVVAEAPALEQWRIKYLSKKGPVQELMGRLKDVPKEDKPAFGQAVNKLKNELKTLHNEKKANLGAVVKKTGRFADVSLPGINPDIGSYHPITQMMRQMVSCLKSLGFAVAEGPEIEDEFHNFNALNIPPNHPARAEGDNFYLAEGRLLRSQTSTVQIRVMENNEPPLRIVAPGRVYRPDTVDASHHYMFHQLEGLAVDEGLTMKDLKNTLVLFFTGLFGEDVEIRMRPNFFPFTEPSAEVDLRCTFCAGKGCSTCQQKGWIEMGGCGMVDPNVFAAVGYDPEVYTGFAFGLGIERMAMRKYGIPDIRFLTENDVRFLSQFK